MEPSPPGARAALFLSFFIHETHNALQRRRRRHCPRRARQCADHGDHNDDNTLACLAHRAVAYADPDHDAATVDDFDVSCATAHYVVRAECSRPLFQREHHLPDLHPGVGLNHVRRVCVRAFTQIMLNILYS